MVCFCYYLFETADLQSYYGYFLALCQLSFFLSITTGVMGINGGCLRQSAEYELLESCVIGFCQLENKASPETNLVQFVCSERLHVIEGEFLGLLMSWKLSQNIPTIKNFQAN